MDGRRGCEYDSVKNFCREPHENCRPSRITQSTRSVSRKTNHSCLSSKCTLYTYSINFHVSVNLASFVERQFLRLTLFVHIIFPPALFELLNVGIPSFFPIRFDDILTRIATMGLICFGAITITTCRYHHVGRSFIGWRRLFNAYRKNVYVSQFFSDLKMNADMLMIINQFEIVNIQYFVSSLWTK